MLGNLLIIGDSYSTYEGMIPEGYAVYYSKEGRGDPEFMVTKMELEDTWWMRLINATGATLAQNNSWSGSTLCYTGYSGDCSHTSSFIYRYRQLKDAGFFKENKIDTVLVFGGTNDSWANAPLGELKYDGFEEGDLFCVLPAIKHFIKRIAQELSDTKLVIIGNCDIKSEVTSALALAAERAGASYVGLSCVDKVNGHPTELGMEQIKDQILASV